MQGKTGSAMGKKPSSKQEPPDQPFLDPTPYGSGKDDSVRDATENAAVTRHKATINGTTIAYTARAGHLVTTEQYSAQPAAKIFYVSFTAEVAEASTRPVTFFYNGGPGSSSVFLLLGSFGPRRIRTSMPHFTPPAPYAIIDNPDSLLDQTDLVFINPVGTGYSGAIAPKKNKDFWGVDKDAFSIKQFVKRYLTVYNRWNSPKFLFGESYGTPRTCVLTWLLHEDGVDLNGVVLQSSILDYSQSGNAVGLLPTFAADAWYHDRVRVSPAPAHLSAFMKVVEAFSRGAYAEALAALPKLDPEFLETLSEYVGIPPVVLKYWQLDISKGSGTEFLTSLLQDAGVAVGSYDGRVTAEDTGIAGSVDPASGGNDPTMTAVGGVYSAMWNVYINNELKFTSAAPFMLINDQAFLNWDFSHVDPTGAEKGGIGSLYTAGDLAAAMTLNPYLKVFSANGYYDAVTPFFQTILNFENMPLRSPHAAHNLTIRNYPSGHMIYLDEESRAGMKSDLIKFYQGATTHSFAAAERRLGEKDKRICRTDYQRRFSRLPY
jgi:carboxypeptidase C (cathepsin A)